MCSRGIRRSRWAQTLYSQPMRQAICICTLLHFYKYFIPSAICVLSNSYGNKAITLQGSIKFSERESEDKSQVSRYPAAQTSNNETDVHKRRFDKSWLQSWGLNTEEQVGDWPMSHRCAQVMRSRCGQVEPTLLMWRVFVAVFIHTLALNLFLVSLSDMFQKFTSFSHFLIRFLAN